MMTINDNLQKIITSLDIFAEEKWSQENKLRNLLLRGNMVDGYPVYIHYIKCLLSKF